MDNKKTLADVTQKVNLEIPNAFAKLGHCNIYIATLHAPTHSEIFVNDISVFLGTEASCKRLLKDILKDLRQNYIVIGHVKDMVCIKKKGTKKKVYK